MDGFFVTIPHSGEEIPPEASWLKDLPEKIVMCDVDRYVDQLYREEIERLKIPVVYARWHRYAVDLNRLPEDVDASTVEGNATPAGKFSRGFHWQHTTTKDVLMPHPMNLKLHEELVTKYFQPFHDDLISTRVGLQARGAKATCHLDLHSMPSLGTSEHRDPGEQRPDLVISDNQGKSASTKFKELVTQAFAEQGFKIAYNWPYYGGRITEMYGDPKVDHHAVQVELNRKLYMDEQTKHARRGLWPALQTRLGKALEVIQRTPF